MSIDGKNVIEEEEDRLKEIRPLRKWETSDENG